MATIMTSHYPGGQPPLPARNSQQHPLKRSQTEKTGNRSHQFMHDQHRQSEFKHGHSQDLPPPLPARDHEQHRPRRSTEPTLNEDELHAIREHARGAKVAHGHEARPLPTPPGSSTLPRKTHSKDNSLPPPVPNFSTLPRRAHSSANEESPTRHRHQDDPLPPPPPRSDPTHRTAVHNHPPTPPNVSEPLPPPPQRSDPTHRTTAHNTPPTSTHEPVPDYPVNRKHRNSPAASPDLPPSRPPKSIGIPAELPHTPPPSRPPKSVSTHPMVIEDFDSRFVFHDESDFPPPEHYNSGKKTYPSEAVEKPRSRHKGNDLGPL